MESALDVAYAIGLVVVYALIVAVAAMFLSPIRIPVP